MWSDEEVTKVKVQRNWKVERGFKCEWNSWKTDYLRRRGLVEEGTRSTNNKVRWPLGALRRGHNNTARGKALGSASHPNLLCLKEWRTSGRRMLIGGEGQYERPESRESIHFSSSRFLRPYYISPWFNPSPRQGDPDTHPV